MPKPITPLVGSDAFVLNEKNEVLLIRRSDNGFWATPGGCHDLGETPKACAERECFEESGYRVECTELLGVFSSNKYEYVNYPWTDTEFVHILFRARLVGGSPTTSSESTEIAWFAEDQLPPLSDGHEIRIKFAFAHCRKPGKPHFE